MSLATEYRHAKKDFEYLLRELVQLITEFDEEERSGVKSALLEVLRFGHKQDWIPGGLESWMKANGFVYWQIDLWKKHLGIN